MNVIISQALATGLPVITTKHSGLPDQVKDGKNGFLVRERNYKELAQKILYYMGHLKLWPEFSKFGRKHVMKNYNSKILIDKQINYYYRVKNLD